MAYNFVIKAHEVHMIEKVFLPKKTHLVKKTKGSAVK
jgi:hypothetical protein